MANHGSTKAPKYVQIADQLRLLIRDGSLRPGSQLPSFSEMHLRFGATPTTVERVYSTLAKEGLIVREHRRGVFVADISRRAVTGTIGFLYSSQIPWRSHPYWTHLVDGLQEEARQQDVEILLLNSTSSAKWEKVDGVVVSKTWEKVEGVPENIVHETWMGTSPCWLPPGMPCVALLSQMEGIPSVLVDDSQSTRDITRYLLERGHRKISFLSSVVDPVSQRRIEGYRGALRGAGVEPQDAWIRRVEVDKNSDLHYLGAGYECMKKWLSEGWAQLGCTALMTQNDDTARGAIRAFREANIAVPDEVSVVGFDGIGVDPYSFPRLTTVEVPLQEIGATGIRMLLQQINQTSSIPTTVLLPARVREGESVKTLSS